MRFEFTTVLDRYDGEEDTQIEVTVTANAIAGRPGNRYSPEELPELEILGAHDVNGQWIDLDGDELEKVETAGWDYLNRHHA